MVPRLDNLSERQVAASFDRRITALPDMKRSSRDAWQSVHGSRTVCGGWDGRDLGAADLVPAEVFYLKVKVFERFRVLRDKRFACRFLCNFVACDATAAIQFCPELFGSWGIPAHWKCEQYLLLLERSVDVAVSSFDMNGRFSPRGDRNVVLGQIFGC